MFGGQQHIGGLPLWRSRKPRTPTHGARFSSALRAGGVCGLWASHGGTCIPTQPTTEASSSRSPTAWPRSPARRSWSTSWVMPSGSVTPTPIAPRRYCPKLPIAMGSILATLSLETACTHLHIDSSCPISLTDLLDLEVTAHQHGRRA